MKIGTNYSAHGRCEFVVWAPFRKKVALKTVSPDEQTIPMTKDRSGYWRLTVENMSPRTKYYYLLDNEIERPDPASHFQPEGVHGPSQIVNHIQFPREDHNWQGIPLEEMIIYELHPGTFTDKGTLKAVIPRLDDLGELGINTIEIMPVAQFPGARNWGYDGVNLFAVQNSYGGPRALKELVNACHRRGLAVILDVVYNHLGPEGNYLRDFGPYFTGKYKTPWGEAVNFDDEYSDDVRNFFIENALHWFGNYHVDALRLDAIHAIFDMSAKPFLQELAEKVEAFSAEQGRKFYLIAESNLNDVRTIRPTELGGHGMDAQWSDDFHHALHTLLTGENTGYYVDFGQTDHLVKAIGEGFTYDWKYSRYRQRHHGSSSAERPGKQFVVCIQNHDQVGNRMLGDRLSVIVPFEALKLAAGTLLLSPYIPMLFMGEEYGERTPFLYFVSHGDPELIRAVWEGRKAEFEAFRWEGEPPDPQSEETFLRSKLNWEQRETGKHGILLKYYRKLIQLRTEVPALKFPDKSNLQISSWKKEKVIGMHRWRSDSQVFCLMNYNNIKNRISVRLPEGSWIKILDSADSFWEGRGASLPRSLHHGHTLELNAYNFAVYLQQEGK